MAEGGGVVGGSRCLEIESTKKSILSPLAKKNASVLLGARGGGIALAKGGPEWPSSFTSSL